MQQGEQQEQDAGEENPAAGQHNTQDSEYRTGNQQHEPPAGPRGARQPHHPVGTGRSIQADARRRIRPMPAGVSGSIPARPSVRSHQTLPGTLLVLCLKDNALAVAGRIRCHRPPAASGLPRTGR
jgi:hypothetical protein